ncbi:MAG: hypothetical protein J3K34DRAFT_34493 [Monoraphidium minutum]|nr:MAG: hypothetical protein J3K34DRAFT_34493 [Monoraphidium minutum]
MLPLSHAPVSFAHAPMHLLCHMRAHTHPPGSRTRAHAHARNRLVTANCTVRRPATPLRPHPRLFSSPALTDLRGHAAAPPPAAAGRAARPSLLLLTSERRRELRSSRGSGRAQGCALLAPHCPGAPAVGRGSAARPAGVGLSPLSGARAHTAHAPSILRARPRAHTGEASAPRREHGPPPGSARRRSPFQQRPRATLCFALPR